MSKELDTIEYLNALCDYQITNKNKDNYEIVKQALIKAQEQEKVLSIIKEKNVDIHWIKKCKTLDEYNDTLNSWELGLTEEEFNTLKEYFK